MDNFAPSASPFSRQVQLRHLRCLAAVARERHLGRAAQQLSLSQPAVSKTLAELEALVGQSLVLRGRRGAQLTEAGQRVLHHALEVLGAVERASAALSGAQPQARETILLGALPTVAPAILPAALARLHAAYPQVNVCIRTDNQAQLVDALRAGALDMAVIRASDPAMLQGLSFEWLYMEPLRALVRSQHPLAQPGRKPSLGAVLAYPQIAAPVGTAPRHMLQRVLAQAPQHGELMLIETLSVSTARLLLQQLDAVWWVSPGAVAQDLLQKTLAALDVDTAGTEEAVGLARRVHGRESDALTHLAQVLREIGVQVAGLRANPRGRRP
jgi:LysR family transcriptional regulator, pca operon transcriptional activator